MKSAEKRGIEVQRQGEWFFIKSDISRKTVPPQYKWYKIGGDQGHHYARDAIKLSPIKIYVAGTVRHNYEHRAGPEHRMLRLGDEYYWRALKNKEINSVNVGGGVD